jgi:hypothetical protein
MESFNPPEQVEPLVQRLEVVGKHAAPALYNAAEMKRVPFRFLWWPVLKVQEGLGGKARFYTVGAVGSQTLLGLPAVHRLLEDPALASRARLWPFETAWDRAIGEDAVVIAEMWPSLVDCSRQSYPIKDECQVAVVRDWALDQPAALARGLARPADLSDEDERVAREVEGWIVENV